jgi:membrane protein DedA with SNARE-associated domain
LRFGSYLGLTEERIKLGQYLFIKHGGKVVFFGRFFAVLRFLAAFLAGVNRMTWPNFLVANALGGVIWATLVGLSAYALGRGIHRLQGPVGLLGVIVIVAVLSAIFIYFRRHEAELKRQADAAIPGHLVGYRERLKQDVRKSVE